MTMPGGRRTVDLFILALLLLAVLFAQLKLSNGITSDGSLYFAHLRSIVFDHDLEIAPELDALHQPQRPHHVVPIGPAIVWAPAYLAVAAVDRIGSAAGAWTRTEGIDLGLTGAYVQAAVLSSFFMMAAGLIVLHLRVRREFGSSIAIATSVLVFGATTLAWYVIFEPSMTMPASVPDRYTCSKVSGQTCPEFMFSWPTAPLAKRIASDTACTLLPAGEP